MKEIKTSALPYKYQNELHCNEVMLLPYGTQERSLPTRSSVIVAW